MFVFLSNYQLKKIMKKERVVMFIADDGTLKKVELPNLYNGFEEHEEQELEHFLSCLTEPHTNYVILSTFYLTKKL